jgi:hypothetical protein
MDSYQFFSMNAPEVENPNLDKNRPYVEQLISCKCFAQYRVFVNGKSPTPDIKMDGVFCPHCGAPASDFKSISGHSGGCFNATIGFYG